MDILVNFLSEHWILSLLFIAFFTFYIVLEIFSSNQDNKVSSQMAIDLVNHQHAVIFDIRSKELFEAGHILDSIHVSKEDLINNNVSKKFQKYKDKPIIVVCTNGRDAPKAINLLQKQNFQQVFQLATGMQDWVANGLPTTKGVK